MKKFLTPIAITACVLCLAGCSMGSEPTNKRTDPLPDTAVESEVEEETTTTEEETTTEATTEATTETHVKNDEATQEETTETTGATTEETTEVQDPYAGLAVSKCHSVTLPKGVDYNTAIAEITKGTTAYPNTFPVIDNVDFNTPGVYSCAWVRLMDDGTYLPLKYATFKVTIVDEYTGSGIINAEYCAWSISNHSLEIVDYAKQYVHYYGTGTISGALTKELGAPGEYTIRWTSTDGATFDQTVLVTE
jgi:hypothetical protein